MIKVVSKKADVALSGKTNPDHELKHQPNSDDSNMGGSS